MRIQKISQISSFVYQASSNSGASSSKKINQYVKLNVGGSLFQTTIGTLTSRGGMLKYIFSGNFENQKGSDGKCIGMMMNHFKLDETWAPSYQCLDELSTFRLFMFYNFENITQFFIPFNQNMR